MPFLVYQNTILWKVISRAMLQQIIFVSKILADAGTCYSNIEKEVLDILHCLEKCYHYCFANEGSMIKDHKPLVALLRKICKPTKQAAKNTIMNPLIQHNTVQTWPQLFIADWLSRHKHETEMKKYYVHAMVTVACLEQTYMVLVLLLA